MAKVHEMTNYIVRAVGHLTGDPLFIVINRKVIVNQVELKTMPFKGPNDHLALGIRKMNHLLVNEFPSS